MTASIIKTYGTMLRNYPEVEKQASGFIVGMVSKSVADEISVPASFDGRVVWKKYLSGIKTQGTCGMCYACGSVGALADRYNILSLGTVHVNLSASDMVMCMVKDPVLAVEVSQFGSDDLEKYHQAEIEERKTRTCKGNTLYNASIYLYIQGAPLEECVPDTLVSTLKKDQNPPFCEHIEGSQFDHCKDSRYAQRVFRSSIAYRLYYDENDLDAVERAIKMEIYKWGPVAGGFIIYDSFLNDYDGKSIYSQIGFGEKLMGHTVKIVGWGEEQQDGRLIKYWICANSWSTEWGDGGYFKIEMFLRGMELEKNIIAFLPDLPGLVVPEAYVNRSDITKDYKEARRALGVNEFTGYTSTTAGKIEDGILQGDLDNIVINPGYMPKNFNTFIAGEIDNVKLKSIMSKTPVTVPYIWGLLLSIAVIIYGLHSIRYKEYSRFRILYMFLATSLLGASLVAMYRDVTFNPFKTKPLVPTIPTYN